MELNGGYDEAKRKLLVFYPTSLQFNLSSLRLDAVTAAVFKLSRSQVETYIEGAMREYIILRYVNLQLQLRREILYRCAELDDSVCKRSADRHAKSGNM